MLFFIIITNYSQHIYILAYNLYICIYIYQEREREREKSEKVCVRRRFLKNRNVTKF